MSSELNEMPNHIAIIMDGNRRWAKNKGMPAIFGHTEGVKSLENIVKYSNKIGIKSLTVYAFSTENWKRDKSEVDALVALFNKYLDEFEKKYKNENIKIKVIGDVTRFGKSITEKVEKLENSTKENTGIIFNIALNYGGREELLKVTREISALVKSGKIAIEDVNEKLVDQLLYTHESGDVDLMIRTSGEMRVSNFLPWQISYSEMYFTNVMWPDFDENQLDIAIEEFKNRNRKFGGK